MNKKFLYLIVAVVIILVALGGYFMLRDNGTSTNQNGNTPGQSTTTQPQPQPTTTQAENLVVIKDFAFSPADMKIKKGTTVTWKNEDSAIHDVKSDSFESKDLATGDTFQFTFDNAGTFSYICSIHPSMTGTVTVE